MADASEAGTSSSEEDAENIRNGSPSRPLLQPATCSTGSVPNNQGSELTDAASYASRHPAEKVNSAGRDGTAPGNTLGGDATAGGSIDAVNSGGPLKIPKPKLDLRALFDYHSRKREERRRKWLGRARGAGPKRTGSYTKRFRVKLSKEERRRRYLSRGHEFPFIQKLYGTKHLPLRLVCLYEQDALEGYFRYIKMLKLEHHIKKSLTEVDAAGDLENECLESRKYKYLDDDGPLSPIEETNGEDEEGSDEEDTGVEIVDKSSFILSSTIPPQKKKSKKSHRSGTIWRI